MAERVTLAEDGPLGKAGEQVWVNDAEQADKPAKKTAPKKSTAKKSSK